MEAIRPSSDLRNKYSEISALARESREPIYITVNGREDTVIMNHSLYGEMRAKLELLTMLAEAQEDVDNGRVAPIKETFDSIRAGLLARKNHDV